MNRLIISIICLILSIAIGIGLLWPRASDLAETKEKLRMKEIELQYKKEYFSKLRLISEGLGQYSEELKKISASLPEDPNLPILFDFLQKTASQNGLILKNISLVSQNPFPKNPEIKEIHLSLVLSGSYSALKDFLNSLYHSARLIEVENVNFLSSSEGEAFSFNLKVKAYSY